MSSKEFNILVVDDIVLMTEFLYSVVSRLPGCRALKALDGKTAADILEHEVVDMLITDIEMRAPSGVELTYRLRSGQFSTTPNDIPVIIFSGNSYLELLKVCMQLDVNDFVAKPVNSNILSQKILQHIQKAKAVRPPAYYQQVWDELMVQKHVSEVVHQHKIFIVRDVPDAAAADEHHLPAETDREHHKDKPVFMLWPEHATTGNFQLDRRMHNLAYRVNCFHDVYVAQCKNVAKEKEQKKVIEAIDYLFHIIRSQKEQDHRPDFWRLFEHQMEKLRPIAEEMSRLNVRHQTQVQAVLKRLSYWWMQTCNRPLIRITQDNGEDEQHAAHTESEVNRY